MLWRRQRTFRQVRVSTRLLRGRKLEAMLRRSRMLEDSVDWHNSRSVFENSDLYPVDMLALQRHEVKTCGGVMADGNIAFKSVRRGLNETRSRDNGAIAYQEELTSSKLC